MCIEKEKGKVSALIPVNFVLYKAEPQSPGCLVARINLSFIAHMWGDEEENTEMFAESTVKFWIKEKKPFFVQKNAN